MNTTFANNMITKNGGGAAVQAESSVVTMLGVLVAHNVAHDMGGAVSSTGGLLQVVHSLFLNNTSSEAGGALSIDYTQTSVGNTVFANNTAEVMRFVLQCVTSCTPAVVDTLPPPSFAIPCACTGGSGRLAALWRCGPYHW